VRTVFATTTPVDAVNERAPVELGTAFTVTKAGDVTAFRFYKSSTNTGVHRGTLWSPDGRVLARINFANETASGWQRVQLTTPVRVEPGITYVVSYFSPGGRYSATNDYFTQQRVSGSLVAPSGNNGRYLYASNGGYPTGSWRSSAYFVDAEIDFGAITPGGG
jgi:hypothetical protein